MDSVAPLASTTVPPPVHRPVLPLQVLLAPDKVSRPLPSSVPPVCVKLPATVEAPWSASVPPFCRLRVDWNVAAPATCRLPPDATVIGSAASSLFTEMAELIVTVGFAAGPRSMITESEAPGTTPALQLTAVLKLPLESVFQILTPVKLVPRCRKVFLLSAPCAKGSRPLGGTTVAKLPLRVPPALMMWNTSPGVALNPLTWATPTVPPRVTLPVTCRAS